MREALPALIRRALAEPRDDVLVERVNDAWTPTSSAQLLSRVESVACAIRDAGLVAGDRVALIAHNCVDWIVCDFATFFAGCVVVPIYPTQALDHTTYILEHSGARLLFVDSHATLGAAAVAGRDASARDPIRLRRRRRARAIRTARRRDPRGTSRASRRLRSDAAARRSRRADLYFGNDRTTQGRHAFARQPKL